MLSRLLKILGLCSAVTMISLVGLSSLRAQTTDGQGGGGSSNDSNYLYNIMINTAGILEKVKDLPTMLTNLTTMALSWVAPDDTDATANLQQQFATLASALLAEDGNQLSLQPRLLAELFDKATPQNLSYANDLTFTTLLGVPYFAKDPRNKDGQVAKADPAFNYIKNASGLGIRRPIPVGLGGAPMDQLRYIYYFNTVSSVETFNAYVLSALYAESKNPNGGFTATQRQLITQASSSDWFSQISSAKLGVVLRQLLMYQSQMFMLMTQTIKLQRQQLEAQVMTNTMLMAINSSNEQNLINRAMSR